MATKTASKSRQGTYTAVHKCSGCGKAFWADTRWPSGTTGKYPHCDRLN